MASKSTSNAFPGYDRLFLLWDPVSPRAYRGRISIELDAFGLTRGEAPARPVAVEWATGGRTPGDVIWTTSVAPVIVSDRVLDVLRAAGFRGWDTYPVEVVDAEERRVPGYHGLSIHARSGPIDDSRSVKVDRIFPGGVFPMWKGLFFDPTSWDGSDLFMPAGTNAFIFVVKEVRDAFRKAKIKNVVFKSVTEMENASRGQRASPPI
jgi:hypothetical protein